MRHCSDGTGRWPDASADVSSNEMDDFRAHAEVCQYHAEILREEFEEELRSVFRLAAGLNDEGRIMRGGELQNAIAEHERHEQEWEAGGRQESPVGLISLYNDGKLIAAFGEFRNYTYQLALHDLNPQAGLQIRARCASDSNEEVLLGFYALRGVCHNGEELLLLLDNGYTVGLKVEQIVENSFIVHFRCVENEVIENEKAEGTQTDEQARGTGAGGLFLNYASPTSHFPAGILPQGFYGWLPQVGNWRMTALCVSLSALLCVTTSGCFLLGKYWLDTRKSAAWLKAEAQVQQPSKPSENNPDGQPEEQNQATPPPRKTKRSVKAKRSRRFGRNLAKVLIQPRNDERPMVTVHRDWVIVWSTHQVGTDIDIKHSGTDPELKNKLRRALVTIERLKALEEARRQKTPDEIGSPREVANTADTVDTAEASAHKADYETFWTVIRPQVNSDTQSKIAVEVRTPSGDNKLSPTCILEFKVTESAAGLDESDVKNAVQDVHAQVTHLLRRSQQESARDTTPDSLLNQAPRKWELDIVEDERRRQDSLEESQAVRSEEEDAR